MNQMRRSMNKINNSENEVIYKAVLEISVVGSSRHVTFDIKNYPEDFGEQSNPIEMEDLPESYKIMQQIMDFITNEVCKGPYEPSGSHKYQ